MQKIPDRASMVNILDMYILLDINIDSMVNILDMYIYIYMCVPGYGNGCLMVVLIKF